MALNWAMLDENRRHVPIQDENTIMTVEKAEILLIIPGEVSGASDPKRLREFGTAFLTDQRVTPLTCWIFDIVFLFLSLF